MREIKGDKFKGDKYKGETKSQGTNGVLCLALDGLSLGYGDTPRTRCLLGQVPLLNARNQTDKRCVMTGVQRPGSWGRAALAAYLGVAMAGTPLLNVRHQRYPP